MPTTYYKITFDFQPHYRVRLFVFKHLANNTKICYTYDSLSRVTTRTIKSLSDNSVISTETFSYDAAGNITDTFEYDTYGKMTEHVGCSFVIFGYNGRDGVVTDDNGLVYMRARYYSPEMRRFINADILHGEISDSTSLNRYSYVNGNPVSYVDPFGLSVEERWEAVSTTRDVLHTIDELINGSNMIFEGFHIEERTIDEVKEKYIYKQLEEKQNDTGKSIVVFRFGKRATD